MQPFEEKMRKGGAAALEEVGRFFMRTDPVNVTLRKIAKKLQELRIPYAVAGGMALVAHGYDRTTADVDILLTSEGLAAAHQALEGLGYVAPFRGSKNLRDVETEVRIEFLITGGFPGDGKPKPIAFPDPQNVATEIQGVHYVGLPQLIELKLASGMTNPGRVKDLGDVQELIRTLSLPKDFGARLHEYVRAKYQELWQGLQDSPGHE